MYALSAKELWRNRLGLLLLLVIPPFFLTVAVLTAGDVKIPVRVFLAEGTLRLLLRQKDISLVFVTAAVSGFLSSYYATLLFHQGFDYFRYCVSMGLPPRSLVFARFGFFFTVVVAVAALDTVAIDILRPVHRPFATFLGFALLAVVYGAYGGIVGLMSRDLMVAILFIVLLANVDAGWLQNPVYYSYAQQTEFIRWLPAFWPCQLVFTGIFTPRGNFRAVLASTGYCGALFVVLLVLVHLRLRRLVHG